MSQPLRAQISLGQVLTGEQNKSITTLPLSGGGKMKIRILGSGTPIPSLDRMSSGYLFEIDEDVILMDCGPSVYHRLMEAGLKIKLIVL